MKICIYGAGAVGGHLAARIGTTGADVSAIARGAHMEAIRRNGIVLLSGEERIVTRLRCSADPRELGTQDAVIVTVKGPALPAIVDGLKSLLGEGTIVVYAMNGIPWWYFAGLDGPHADVRIPFLDPGGRLWDEVGIARTVGCVVASANEVIEPGVVRHRPPRSRFTLGRPDGGSSDRVRALAGVLTAAGLEAPVTADIRSAIWRKFLTGNMAVSVLAALTGATADGIQANPETQALCQRIVREGLAVARALGTELADYDPVVALDPRNIAPGIRPSMLQDLELGRPVEIDSFVTAVQFLAERVGVATPTFDTVAAILKMRARQAGLWPQANGS